MNYRVVDLDKYPRRETFLFFKNQRNCVYSLTIKINIEKVYYKSKELGIGFYPLFMSILTEAVNSFEFSRMDLDENGRLIVYEFVVPCYTIFHHETNTYSCMNTEYVKDMIEYAKRMDFDIKSNVNNMKFCIKEQPKNGYPVSTLPWIDYDNLTIKVFDVRNNFLPMITWGKFDKSTFQMPISFEINHAVMDGYHLHLLIDKLNDIVEKL